MSYQPLALVHGPVDFAGVVDLEITSQGVRPWRLPVAQLPFHDVGLVERAGYPAGVRLTFASDTANVRLQIETAATTPDRVNYFDLVIGGQIIERIATEAADSVVEFRNIPGAGSSRVIEVYLPQARPVRVLSVSIDAAAGASRWHDPRPRWITYGSSITQCRTAAGPSEIWPAIVARSANLHLTCLGFGGQCHLDPLVARVIRDLPADLISLCLGINVQGASSLSRRTFRPAIYGLVAVIRERHPLTPIVLISPICSPPREEVANSVGLSLTHMRQEVAAAAETLVRHGDANLRYQDGLELLGPSLVQHLHDQLHPSAEGYRVLAAQFLQYALPKIHTAAATTAAVPA